MESTCELDLKQHAELGKKIAGPCNCIKKLSGRGKAIHVCWERYKYVGLELFCSDWKQLKAEEKETFYCLILFQIMPLLMEHSILAGRMVDAGVNWPNPVDTKKSSARGGKNTDKTDRKS